jgi:hypothetical protein
MTDFTVPTAENADDCPVCGNPLASSDAACPRCHAKPAAATAAATAAPTATPTAAEPPAPEAAPKDTFSDRSAGKRTPVDSPYPSFSEPETTDQGSNGQPGRRVKLAGGALIALIGLVAGVSYLHHGSSPYNRQAKPVAAALATSLPEPALRDKINSPVSAKNASLDVMGTIDAARSAMVRGELNAARRQLAMLPSSQDQRSDVRRITDELNQREQERDSALVLARACERARDMPCVLRSAGDALASDVSNSEARDMLLRAVAQSGVNQAAAVSTSERAAPAIVTYRRSPERHKVRRRLQMFANENEIYSKH